jgi:hypothetical protein
MKLPERVDSAWVGALATDKLLLAEAQLHAVFVKEEAAEKKRMGARYNMMRGSEALVSAWLRWLTASNEAESRHVRIRRAPAPA